MLRRRNSIVPEFNRQWIGCQELITETEEATTAAQAGAPEDDGSSPLLRLLKVLRETWNALTPGGTSEQFEEWLEENAVIGAEEEDETLHLRFLRRQLSLLVSMVAGACESASA
jgi:hypothetical protein